MSTKQSTKSFSVKLGDDSKILIVLYYHIDLQSKGVNVEKQSYMRQVTESNSSNCNFRNALIVPIIGLFLRFRFFYLTNHESHAAFHLSDPPFVNSIYMCSRNEITKIGIYYSKRE